MVCVKHGKGNDFSDPGQAAFWWTAKYWKRFPAPNASQTSIPTGSVSATITVNAITIYWGNFTWWKFSNGWRVCKSFQCKIKFGCKKLSQTLPVSKKFPCWIFSVQMLAVGENYPDIQYVSVNSSTTIWRWSCCAACAVHVASFFCQPLFNCMVQVNVHNVVLAHKQPDPTIGNNPFFFHV